MRNKRLLSFLLLLGMASAINAQNGKQGVESSKMETKADYSKDHESIDAIIKATYDVISGPKNQKRDWDRFRSLFYKGARLIPSGKGPGDTIGARVDLPDDYIKRSGPFLIENGFFEQEVARRSEVFGNIAHVFSTYEGRRNLDDDKPFLRGINSFQLLNDGKRWWILTIFWMAESEDNPLPEKYLRSVD